MVGGTEIQSSSVTGIAPASRSIFAPRPLHCCVLGRAFRYNPHMTYEKTEIKAESRICVWHFRARPKSRACQSAVILSFLLLFEYSYATVLVALHKYLSL